MPIRVIRGNATLTSGQTCTTSCITAPRGAVICSTACSSLQVEEPDSFPIPSRGSPDVVDDLFISSGPLGTSTFYFNPYVVGEHRKSSQLSIGHAQPGWSPVRHGDVFKILISSRT